MYESHSCAFVCSDATFSWAALLSCLYVRPSDASSLNETSCAISASVLVWNEPVRLITIGVSLTSTFHGLCHVRAFFVVRIVVVCGIQLLRCFRMWSICIR